MKADKFELNKWYELENSTTPNEILISVLKKRIDEFNDFEFNSDFTQFRRIIPFKEFLKSLEDPNSISFKIEWHDQKDVVFDYSHLPQPIFTPHDKKTKRRVI